MRRHAREKGIVAKRVSTLTEREQQVMVYLIRGKNDKQIASELNISVRGIAFHRASILKKMVVESLVELALDIAKLDS